MRIDKGGGGGWGGWGGGGWFKEFSLTINGYKGESSVANNIKRERLLAALVIF